MGTYAVTAGLSLGGSLTSPRGQASPRRRDGRGPPFRPRVPQHTMKRMIRILVIEDEPSVRHGLVRVLANAGYDVAETANGADGLRLWREAGADLVLTDILMPHTNGIEVILEP